MIHCLRRLGALMYDPVIGDGGNVQGQYPINQFAQAHKDILGLNEGTLAKMDKCSAEIGYTEVSTHGMLAMSLITSPWIC